MRDSKYISSNPNIMSGKPVIAGTRIPIARILFLLKDGYTLEMIHEEYPHVSLKTLNRMVDELIEWVDNPIHAPKSL